MIPTGLFEFAIHALLYNDPMAVVADDEPVQVKLVTILDSGAVDLRYQAAGRGERGPIKAHFFADIDQLVRRIPRIFTSPAADVDAELLLKRSQPALQGTDHARRDIGGMPVHAHYGAERLEPEWWARRRNNSSRP